MADSVRRDVELPLNVIAHALGVHVNTVSRWLKSGVLSGRRLADVVALVRSEA